MILLRYIKDFLKILKTYLPDPLKNPSALNFSSLPFVGSLRAYFKKFVGKFQFVTTRLKKNNYVYLTYSLFFFVFLGILSWNFNYASLDFVLKLNYLIFFSISVVFSALFFYKYFSLFPQKTKINVKNLLSNLSEDILDLKISNKTLLFSLLNFIVSLILINYSFLRISLIFIFFSFFLLIKELKHFKTLIEGSQLDYEKLTLLYKKEYRIIYYFSHLIKFLFFIYICYFCVWVLFLQPTFFLHEISSFDSYGNYVLDSCHHLYFSLLLFTNSVLLDFTMESIIAYSHYELFLQFSPGSFLRRGARLLAFTGGGASAVGIGLAYTPAVDVPGVNYYQIHYGRGYGYASPVDWTKGMVLQSYLKKEALAELVEKHGNKNKIVDGQFYIDVLNKENILVQTLNKKCTPMEQRLLGLRTF